MRVSVSLCAVLRDLREAGNRRSAGANIEIEVAEDVTLDDAIRTLDLPTGMEWIACVNGRPSPGDTRLTKGDRLYVFVPVSGG